METQRRSSFAEIPSYRSHRRSFCDMDASERRKRSCAWYANAPFHREHKVHRKATVSSDCWHPTPVFDIRPDEPIEANSSNRNAPRKSPRDHGVPSHGFDRSANRSVEANGAQVYGATHVAPATNVDAGNGIDTARNPSDPELTKTNDNCVDVSSKFELRAVPGRTPRPLIDVTNKFELKSVPVVKRQMEEGDIHRLCQRQKQIEYGRNTSGYERYIELVPKSKRKGKDPQTPNPKQICSKRSWDGQIRKWRRLLHNYDPPMEAGAEEADYFSTLMMRRGTANDSNIGDDGSKEDEQGNGSLRKNLDLSIYDDWVEPEEL